MRAAAFGAALLVVSAAAAFAQVRVIQTNSQGDNIHLIDPSTHQIVGEIKGVPINHGAAAAPDGSRFYFSSEAEQTLHVVAGSIAGRLMTVIDQKTEEPIWTLFEEGVRPMAFETNPDGSTKRIFVQISNLHGFAVVDFAQRKEVARITLPDDIPAENVDKGPFNASPSHGLGVAPDGRTLWVTSRPNARVYAYALPDLKLLGAIDVGGRPDWVTFTPDSRFVYISTENRDSVVVIDVAARKEVTKVKVGRAPKRNITVSLGGSR